MRIIKLNINRLIEMPSLQKGGYSDSFSGLVLNQFELTEIHRAMGNSSYYYYMGNPLDPHS